jgi:hypothetical protein
MLKVLKVAAVEVKSEDLSFCLTRNSTRGVNTSAMKGKTTIFLTFYRFKNLHNFILNERLQSCELYYIPGTITLAAILKPNS